VYVTDDFGVRVTSQDLHHRKAVSQEAVFVWSSLLEG
jgi:hypothetical protein